MSEPLTTEHRGCRLAYRIRGDGPPLLFIQGVGVHGDGWLPQVNSLASRFRCVTFDNRGMGHSQSGDSPVTIEQMADDALAVLDAAGCESAHVVGHSLGGLVAIRLALAARPRVRSLALLCSFADGRAVGPLSWRLIWAGLRMQLGTRRMKRRAFLDLVTPIDTSSSQDRDALAERLAPLFGHDLADQPAAITLQMKAMRAFDATPRLGELKGLPTLVVSAEHDPIAPPRLGRALASGIPGSRYVELPGASHGVPLTDPERVNELLLEHYLTAGPH